MISKTLSLVTLFVVAQAATNLDYSKVHLLDYKPNGNTWLFRTNLPMVDGAFAYDKLRGYMAQRAAEINVSFPSADQALKISDFSLLNWFEEPDLLTTEQTFFKENPTLGDFSFQQIAGSLLNPNDYNEENLRIFYILAMDNGGERLPTLMKTFYSQIHDHIPSTPTAYIIHGKNGTERTGEIAGTYIGLLLVDGVQAWTGQKMAWL
ncbi:hypothetical protein FGO68_gene14841 [Halteria grandinella]|uniref:Uncharacterized protein n=1 Tax=Halteria grandinella TaxID=5974 RepID=A0A8J8NRC4_HALGN|nr:hypothetical protein FGO68_gene14841 [Halteria grandinella]